jgi:hypothetical protein
LQDAPRNFSGQLGNRGFHFAASRGNLSGDPFFAGGNSRRRSRTRFFNKFCALLKQLLPLRFLLRINPCARLL